jgi:hypothetical protein
VLGLTRRRPAYLFVAMRGLLVAVQK